MSLFNMLRRSVNNAVKNAVESAVEAKIAPVIESRVEKYIKPFMEDRTGSAAQPLREPDSQVTLYQHSGAPEDYFHTLLCDNLPGCTVEKNIPAAQLFPGNAQEAMPRNLLISRMGKPVLLILLLPKNSYRRKHITELKQRCENAGISHMQFFLEFRNEAGYVVSRVQKAL